MLQSVAPLATHSKSQSLLGLTRSAHCPLPCQFALASPMSFTPLVHPIWWYLIFSSILGTLKGALHLFSVPRTFYSHIASSLAHSITWFRALLPYHHNGEAFPDVYEHPTHFAPLLYSLQLEPSDWRAGTLPLLFTVLCPMASIVPEMFVEWMHERVLLADRMLLVRKKPSEGTIDSLWLSSVRLHIWTSICRKVVPRK